MKKPTPVLTLMVFCFLSCFSYADDLFIKNARIYTLAGEGVIENGNILIVDGKIHEVGEDSTASPAARVIDASGKQITPGLVNAYTHLGITEIYAVSRSSDLATEDVHYSVSFSVTPAINPSSTLVPFNRSHGLTHAIVVPESGHHLFAGQGAVIRLSAPESFIVDDSVAVFANYGSQGGEFAGGSRAAAYLKMRQALLDAGEYDRHRQAMRSGEWRKLSLPVHDLAALLPVLKQNKPLVVTVERASDIRNVLKLKDEFRLNLIIAGAAEAWMLADELAAAKAPVLIDPMMNLPLSFDQLGARLDNAARLQAAGVMVLFTGGDFIGTHSAFLVRQAAGNAAAYGMPVIEAIKAMTLNPARAFGFAERFGSIEPGKAADLVIWSGDPLELLTQAEQVIVAGKVVPMASRSTRLRDRYRNMDASGSYLYRK